MQLLTTIVDGMDIQIAPDNFRADAVDWSTVGKGLLGNVHFLWPIAEDVKLVTVYYENLTREQTRRLLSALGPKTVHNKVLEFGEEGVMFFVPGALRLTARYRTNGLWAVDLDTYARLYEETYFPV